MTVQAREEMCMPQGRLGLFTGPRRTCFTVSKGKYRRPDRNVTCLICLTSPLLTPLFGAMMVPV